MLLSCNYRHKDFKQQQDKNELKNYNLEQYLPKSKTNALYKTLSFFNLFLNDNYSEIPIPEDRMFAFIKDLSQFYSNNNENSLNESKLLKNINAFCPYLSELKQTKLLDDIFIDKNTKVEYSDDLANWINSILKKEGFASGDSTYKANNEVIVNQQPNSTLYRFNCKSDYYYAIYNVANNREKVIKEYIEQIVSSDCITFTPDIYLDKFIQSVAKKELNSPIFKSIIFTDFYLPLLLQNKKICE